MRVLNTRYLRQFNLRKLLTILFLGFSSGLPLALSGSTLQAWFAVANVSIMTIGVLSLVGQPYVYKFIWAPLLDRFALPFLGRRRGWIMVLQCLLAATMALMALFNPAVNPWMLGGLGFVMAFLSATQDIAIDAYRADVLKPAERGMGAAMAIGGYRVAILVSGALALILAATLGWRWTYLIMAILTLVSVLATLWGPEPQQPAVAPASLKSAIVAPLKEFLTRRNALLILLFIVIYKLGDAFALTLNTAFLLKGVGFSLMEVGTINKVLSLIASILGVFTAGFLMPKLGAYWSLLWFGVLQAISNLTFMMLAIVGKSYLWLVIAVFLEHFTGGLATAAFLAFIMGLCDQRFTATQFALLSALSAVGRVFVGPFAAMMVEHLGWTQFYFWTFIIALPGLVLLRWLKTRVDFEREVVEDVSEQPSDLQPALIPVKDPSKT